MQGVEDRRLQGAGESHGRWIEGVIMDHVVVGLMDRVEDGPECGFSGMAFNR
jgi:hypothetical protein